MHRTIYYATLTLLFLTCGGLFVLNYPNSIYEKIGLALIGIGIKLGFDSGSEFVTYLKSDGWKQLRLVHVFVSAGIKDGEFDASHDGRLVKRVIHEGLSAPTKSLMIIGTTLNSLLHESRGVLTHAIRSKDSEYGRNRMTNPIKALMLNPLSTQAIIRSAAESGEYDDKSTPIKNLLRHTLEVHKSQRLYKDSRDSWEGIRAINNSGKIIDCRLFSCGPPSFSIIGDNLAVNEQLTLGRTREPGSKLSGQMPLVLIRQGDVYDALKDTFNVIWHNYSVPLEEFSPNVEDRHFVVNKFLLVQDLQRQYWERRWADPDDCEFNTHNELYTQRAALVLERYCGHTKQVLDLGCGDGGGGSVELLRDCNKRRFRLKCVDFSRSALRRFGSRANIDDSENSKAGMEFVESDVLAFLNTELLRSERQYAMVYSNLSLIYMPKVRAVEVFSQIFRLLAAGGTFLGTFFSDKYFDLEVGSNRSLNQRPDLTFERVPLQEDVRIVMGPVRSGEIRRFYRDSSELEEEILGGDRIERLNWDSVQVVEGGTANCILTVVATKRR